MHPKVASAAAQIDYETAIWDTANLSRQKSQSKVEEIKSEHTITDLAKRGVKEVRGMLQVGPVVTLHREVYR